MRNTIELTGLKVFAFHGVLESEKAYGQEFVIDCHLEVETGNNDNLEEAVNYAAVAEVLVSQTKNQRFDLIETLCEDLAEKVLLFSSRIHLVIVTVNKPMAPIEQVFSNVSVSVTKQRS